MNNCPKGYDECSYGCVYPQRCTRFEYEAAHPQRDAPDPSDCSCFGSDQPCARCGIGDSRDR